MPQREGIKLIWLKFTEWSRQEMPCLLYKFHALDETQNRPVAETILKEP